MTLLTSLRDDSTTLTGVIEQQFRLHYESLGYGVEVHQNSDSYDIWQALHDPAAVGIFWLSHGGCSDGSIPRFATQRILPDIYGFDVTPTFQEIHPNLRFLGIIGCQSALVFQGVLEKYSILQNHPDLLFRAFSQKIDSITGFFNMLEQADSHLAAPKIRGGFHSDCQVKRGLKVKLERKGPSEAQFLPAPALRVSTSQESILGVFPRILVPDVRQETEVYLPALKLPSTRSNLDLIFETGNAISFRLEPHLGALRVLSSWQNAEWHLDEEDQGVTSLILTYTGRSSDQSLVDQEVEYRPFQCDPMPPVLSPLVIR